MTVKSSINIIQYFIQSESGTIEAACMRFFTCTPGTVCSGEKYIRVYVRLMKDELSGYPRACTHANRQSHTSTPAHPPAHVLTRPYPHTHAHAHMCKCVHTYTQLCVSEKCKRIRTREMTAEARRAMREQTATGLHRPKSMTVACIEPASTTTA